MFIQLAEISGIPNVIANLLPNLPNFIAHIIATIVIIVFLSRYVYKPFRNFHDQRGAKIDALLDDAVQKQTQAALDEKRGQMILNDAKNESVEIVKNARLDAEAQHYEILNNAKAEVDSLHQQAKASVQRMQTEAESQIKTTIVNVAFDAAEKLLEKNIDKETNQALVDQFIKELN
jgi:F-type H+-transporting ATPase subunit b